MIYTINTSPVQSIISAGNPKLKTNVSELAISILSCVKCAKVSEKPLRLLCTHTICLLCYAKIEKETPGRIKKCPRPSCSELIMDAEECEVLSNVAKSVFQVKKTLAKIMQIIKSQPIRTEETLVILLKNITIQQWKEGVWFSGEASQQKLIDIKMALLRTRFTFLPGVFLIVYSAKQGKDFLIRFFPYIREPKKYVPKPLLYVSIAPSGYPTIR